MKKRSLKDVFEDEDGIWTARDAVRKHLDEIADIKRDAPGITWTAIAGLLLKAGIIQRRISSKTLANYYHEAKALQGGQVLKAESRDVGAPDLFGGTVGVSPRPQKSVELARPPMERSQSVKPKAVTAGTTPKRLSPEPDVVAQPSGHGSSGKYPIFDPEEALASIDESEAFGMEPDLGLPDFGDFPEPEPPLDAMEPPAPVAEEVKQQVKKRIALKM